MSSELHLEGASLETPPRKGVYKELRANPYLFGLSTVKGLFWKKAHNVLILLPVCISWRLSLWLRSRRRQRCLDYGVLRCHIP